MPVTKRPRRSRASAAAKRGKKEKPSSFDDESLAKVEAMALSRCDPATATDALVDLRGERDPARLVATWLASAVARLPAGDLVLDFADGHIIHLRHAQRWRVWRRPLAVVPA